MEKRNFTVVLRVDQSPEAVFDAVNDVRAWWTGEIEGRTDQLGAEFTYRYRDLHRTTHKVTEWVPGAKVVWRITQSYLSFVHDKSEWDGTEIVFEIERKGGQTELRFTHVGLVPEIECYGECSGAWGYFVKESLQSLITTGKGHPKDPETATASSHD